MKKCFKLIITCALLAAFVLCTSACGGKTGEIKSLMKDFENACNNLDLNLMLDSINPDTAKSVRLATGLVSMFTDKNTDEMFENLAVLLLDEAPENAKEFFRQ